MNGNRRLAAASQIGVSGNSTGQQQEIGFTIGKNNDNCGKEGIVQKLQGVLFAVRRDRDREHRSRDISMEKLRSAKEVFDTEKLNFEAEKEKLAKTNEEIEKANDQILQKQVVIQQLQEKYRFQHEDLIRKREKIHQQNSTFEATTLKRNKSVLDARQRLDRQRDKYQKLEKMQHQESVNLIAKIMSSTRDTKKGVFSRNKNATGTTGVESGSGKENIERENLQSMNNNVDKFQETLDRKQEEDLLRELKTNIDNDMLPKMISQKAQALKMENETIHAEINRLEALLHETTNSEKRDILSHGSFEDTTKNFQHKKGV